MTIQSTILKISPFLLLIFVLIPAGALAHVPVLEGVTASHPELPLIKWENAEAITSPNEQSLAVYGKLKQAGEVDVYKFRSTVSEVISVELLVPAWPRTETFFPEVMIIGPGVGERIGRPLPSGINLLPGLTGFVLNNQLSRPRSSIFEPYSLERLYNGEKMQLEVAAGNTYYLAVYEPTRKSGVYSLALGEKENFQNQSLGTVLGNVLKMKLGWLDEVSVPLLNLVSEFLVLLGLSLLFFSGRHLYLNAFTVSDPAGLESIFLRTKSSSMRAFGLGFACWFAGQGWLNRLGWLSQVAFFQLFFFGFLVILFLLLVNKFKVDWWLVKQSGSALSEVRRPRRFRFAYRVYQLVWCLLLVLAIWQNFLNN